MIPRLHVVISPSVSKRNSPNSVNSFTGFWWENSIGSHNGSLSCSVRPWTGAERGLWSGGRGCPGPAGSSLLVVPSWLVLPGDRREMWSFQRIWASMWAKWHIWSMSLYDWSRHVSEIWSSTSYSTVCNPQHQEIVRKKRHYSQFGSITLLRLLSEFSKKTSDEE